MQLHARQCLLELLAFPEAACLLFAVLNYKPGEEPSARNYDSVLHRLNRASAMEALAEIRERGVMRDFAKGIENADVDDIISRMVSAAVELPKVSRMRTAQAAALLPELFAEIPEHLRQHIAKGFRYDDDVPEDCRRIAALGDQRIDGVPCRSFPASFCATPGASPSTTFACSTCRAKRKQCSAGAARRRRTCRVPTRVADTSSAAKTQA